MTRFARSLLIVPTLLVSLLLASCATYEPPKTGPRITKFTLEPAEFFHGDAVTATLEYCDAKGGLGGNVEMDYQGSLANQKRNSSLWATSFFGKEPCGTFTNKIYPLPTDPAPFTIAYYIRFKSEGTYSNWATASVLYRGHRATARPTSSNPMTIRESDSALARALLKKSCWAGFWVSGGFGGNLELCFKLDGAALTAMVSNSSGAQYSFDGPVTNLTLHEGDQRVTFVVSSGAPYDLKLISADRLEGVARGGVARITLKPKG